VEKLALIAGEFPGQFPGDKLLNLDLRDEKAWITEAKKREIRREISLLQAIRFGTLAKQQAYEDRLSQLDWQLNQLKEE
jgi:hypothetical protein